MMKYFRKFLFAAAILCVSVLLCRAYTSHLRNEVARLYSEKRNTVSLYTGVPEKDKGCAWLEESGKYEDLIVMGSSELTSGVPQSIRNNFPNTDYEHNISMIGHAYVQNYLHAMELGTNYSALQGCDIVLIESIQWFYGDDISEAGFLSNFSELQFYRFLHNEQLSEESKQYLCSRFLTIEARKSGLYSAEEMRARYTSGLAGRLMGLPFVGKLLRSSRGAYDYPKTHLLAKLYSADGIMERMLYQLMRPYYFLRGEMLELQDSYRACRYLKSLREQEKPIFDAAWEAQLQKAEEEGAASCTNNAFYVADSYYTTYLEPSIEEQRGSYAGTTALSSAEWDDLRFFLRVCNELGAEPYLINVSLNGYYADYTGMEKAMRQAYYTRLLETAEEYGVAVYDGLTEREYEPYVFADIMHLGWKGWIYVTKAITEHYGA